jgi:hypothetical protein
MRMRDYRLWMQLLGFGLMLLASPLLAAEPEYEWINVTKDAAYAARDGAGALVYKDKMWFIGGWNPGDKKYFPRICNNEVWSSTDGALWTLEKPNTFLDKTFDRTKDWEGRHTAGYVVFKDKMWIVSGDCNQGHLQPDIWSSTDGKDWKLEAIDDQIAFPPRCLHYTVVHDGKMWVLGGQTMPGFAPGTPEKFYRDIWTSTDGVKWEEVKPKEPCYTPRGMIGGSAVFKGRIWWLGGGTYDTPTTPYRNFYNDVWSSAEGVTWKEHAKAPWKERQYHDVAVFDDKLWVLEGYHKDSGNRKDVWYSADGENWTELPNTPWAVRHAATVFVYKDALWMTAGNSMDKEVWKLVKK